MAKIRDIKVKLTADTSRVQQVIDQVRAEMEKALKPFNPPRMYIVQDDDESQSIENIKGLKADMAWFDDYASKWEKPKEVVMKQKPKWNVDQILAEAHRVKGEYDHDRRKYRHSSITTGTMRVPAALVVEMLGRPVEWNDETERIMRGWEGVSQSLRDDLDGANEEINTLRKQLAERRYFNETEEIAVLKTKLKTEQESVARLRKVHKERGKISPEERAVLEAVKHWVKEDGIDVIAALTKTERVTATKPLYRAVLALHKAGEKKTPAVSGEMYGVD